MKIKTCCKTITIKRSINITPELRDFIFKNSNYRRKVWNDFTEEYYRCFERREQFKPLKYATTYYNTIEVNNPEYNELCVGIREQVAKDFDGGINRAKQNHGKIRFKKFNRFKCAFKVGLKPTFVNLSNSDIPRFNSRVYLVDDSTIAFRVNRKSSKKDRLYISTREPIFYDAYPIDGKVWFFDKKKHCYFREEDIREIAFIHELGKFYINLVVNVCYANSNKEYNKREEAAGIDLGIRNPITLHDGENTYIIRMSDRELKRIHYLERRTRRLKHIMDKKTYGSKNYYKILRKFRVTWYKITNIRMNWRRKMTKQIATRYKTICVDKFETPTKEEHVGIPKPLVAWLNSYNRIYSMSLFYESISHASEKYSCKYIESPENTTRTCSKCGFINEHLPLSQRVFKCKSCGYEIDRDINASQNCYDFIFES